MRQAFIGNDCFYLLGNAGIKFKSPKTTLSRISQLTRYKGGVYKLYLIDQQRYWNKDPLYVLDEGAAYSNAAWAGIELNLSRGESLEYALEFCFYAEALQKAILTDDSSYAQKEELWTFIEWYTKRCFALVELAKGTLMERDIHYTLQTTFENPGVRMYIVPTPGKGCKHGRLRANGTKDQK